MIQCYSCWWPGSWCWQAMSCYDIDCYNSAACLLSFLRVNFNNQQLLNVTGWHWSTFNNFSSKLLNTWMICSVMRTKLHPGQKSHKFCRWLFLSDDTDLVHSFTCWIDPCHQPYNALVKYPTMHHFATGMCTYLLQNGTLWDIGLLHYGICATGIILLRKYRNNLHFLSIHNTQMALEV